MFEFSHAPVYQKEYCQAIAIKKEVVIAGCYERIKVFDFVGDNLQEKDNIFAHQSLVTHLCFKEIPEQFISGSSDKTIKLWSKQKTGYENIQTCSFLFQIKFLLITGDEVISCNDRQIQFMNKEFECSQTLIFQSEICCVSINKKSNQIVSCGSKGISIHDKSQIWRKRQRIQIYEMGSKICFIDDEIFCYLPWSGGICQFYKLNATNGLFFLFSTINVNEAMFCANGFPMIYNSEKSLLLCKNARWLNIIKKTIDNEFILKQTITLSDRFCQGAITENGEWIIIWDECIKEFQIWSLIL